MAVWHKATPNGLLNQYSESCRQASTFAIPRWHWDGVKDAAEVAHQAFIFEHLSACRLKLRAICKAWKALSECPQLWRSLRINWETSLQDDTDRLRKLDSVAGFFERHKNSVQELSVSFRPSQSSPVVELLTAFSRSSSLTNLHLSTNRFQQFIVRDQEVQHAGVLVMCAAAKITALQTLETYGFPVSLYWPRLVSHIPKHVKDILFWNCRQSWDISPAILMKWREFVTCVAHLPSKKFAMPNFITMKILAKSCLTAATTACSLWAIDVFPSPCFCTMFSTPIWFESVSKRFCRKFCPRFHMRRILISFRSASNLQEESHVCNELI